MGGLFNHGLDVATRSLNYALDREFVHINRTQDKKVLEPRYKIAAFIGGLLHDVAKPATDLDVYSVGLPETHNWDPMTKDLYSWATNLGIDHYRVVWRPGRHKKHEVLAASLARDIIPEAMNEWMREHGQSVIMDLYEALSNQEAKTMTLAQVINSGDRSSTEADHNLDQGNLRGDIPLDRLLVDTIRQLVDAKKIEINKENSLGVYDVTGLYIEWPQMGAKLILDELKANGKGTMFPQTPEILADQMIDWLIIDGTADESRYVRLPNDERLMVKFRSPQLIVDGLEEFAEEPDVSAPLSTQKDDTVEIGDEKNVEDSENELEENVEAGDNMGEGMQTLSAPRVSRRNLLESEDTTMIEQLPDDIDADINSDVNKAEESEIHSDESKKDNSNNVEEKPEDTVKIKNEVKNESIEASIETNGDMPDTSENKKESAKDTSPSLLDTDTSLSSGNDKKISKPVDKTEEVKPSKSTNKDSENTTPTKKKHSLVTVSDAEETLKVHLNVLKKHHPGLIDKTANGVIIQHPNAFAKEILDEIEKEYSIPNNDLLETYSTLRLLLRNGADKTFIHNRRGMECVVLSDEYADYISDASVGKKADTVSCLLYTSPSPRDGLLSRMPSSA